MKEIWKFPLHLDRVNALCGPGVLEPLHFAIQNGQPCLWALVLPDSNEPAGKLFQVFGTGHEIPLPAKYIATTQDGLFVWHLFEVQP